MVSQSPGIPNMAQSEGNKSRADIDDITDCFATRVTEIRVPFAPDHIFPVWVMPGIRQLNRSVLCRKKQHNFGAIVFS